jgi:TonB family protein
MKRCPTCRRVYQGEDLSFCLDDGTPLMIDTGASFDEGAETAKVPPPRLTNQPPRELYPAHDAPHLRPSPQFAQQGYGAEREVVPHGERKSSALPWILGAVILGLSAIVVGLLLMRNREATDSQAADNRASSENAQPAPEGSISTTHHREEVPVSSPVTNLPDEPPPPPPPGKITEPKSVAPISGGVLNGKAISLPKPAYPPIARAVRASGMVTVQVTIDETGKVISARAVGGHPLLQQAAVQAANQARFSPTLLSGRPVKVTGVITYNFVAQ